MSLHNAQITYVICIRGQILVTTPTSCFHRFRRYGLALIRCSLVTRSAVVIGCREGQGNGKRTGCVFLITFWGGWETESSTATDRDYFRNAWHLQQEGRADISRDWLFINGVFLLQKIEEKISKKWLCFDRWGRERCGKWPPRNQQQQPGGSKAI